MSAAATIATICTETADNLNRTALVMGKGIVELLASKYGFDAAEAFEAISFEVPKKTKKAAEKKVKDHEGVVSKKSKKNGPAIPLPFIGIVKADWCMGIRTNHGLFTQCTQPKPTECDYCATCQKQAEANASGKPTYGNINDRVIAAEEGNEWRDPKENKAVAHYGNVAAKLKIDLDAAKAECLKVFGIELPDDLLEVQATKRGRPPKDNIAIVSDTDSASSEKKKGRPKKNKGVIEGGAAGEDLIAGLVIAAQNGEQPKPKKVKASELTEEEKAAKKKEAAEKRAATLAAKKAAQPPKPELSEEEKAAKKKEAAEKRKAAAEAKKQAYIQAAALALLEAKGFSSVAPSTAGSDSETTPVKTKAAPVTPTADDKQVDEDELAIEEIQEISLEVTEWVCPTDNKLYLKSNDNVVYDLDTQDEIGVWNESKQVISFITTDDDDEDDMC